MESVNCRTELTEDKWSDSTFGSCSDMESPQEAGLNDDDDVMFSTSPFSDWPLTSLSELDGDWLQAIVGDSDQTDCLIPADTESQSTVSVSDVTVKQRVRSLVRGRLIASGRDPDDVTRVTSLHPRAITVRHR